MAASVTGSGQAGDDDLERLLAWGRARRPARVLDVATGAGHTALAFAGLGARVLACDLTEAMLQAARRFVQGQGAPGVEFVAATWRPCPIAPGPFPW